MRAASSDQANGFAMTSSAPASRPLTRSFDGAGGQEQHHRCFRPAALQLAQEIGARHTGKIQIQKNQIETTLLAKFGDLVSRGGELYSEVFLLQPGLKVFRQGRVGFSDKKAHSRSLRTNFWKGVKPVCSLLTELSTNALEKDSD
jgi:hypothetical protein